MKNRRELVAQIEQSHTTRELGVWNAKTQERYSQVGRVGEALKAAADAVASSEPAEENDLEDWWEIADAMSSDG